MFRNYFLLAFRSFKKERVNSLISLSGLVIGLACALLVAGYVCYETSFHKSYSNSAHIYRIISDYTKNNSGHSENVPLAFAPTLVREVPEITKQTRIGTYTTQVLIKNRYADFMQSNVDSSFFSIFNFSFIHGDPNTALNRDDRIVLTASTAKKFFNTTDVVGKPFTTRDKTFMITGVAQDMPQNSFLQTEAFCFAPLLTALMAQHRTKEIGIRKVLGASVMEIVSLLSGNFVKLILIAFVIFTPLVWWAMNKWLEDFQYRINISWWIFFIAGIGSLCFALLVVSIQAIKAARANPVESLSADR